MPPKAADKKPANKAPVASKAPEKKDAGKKTASTGEKKKRTKARKETYSSYIYKGKPQQPNPKPKRAFIHLRASHTMFTSHSALDPILYSCLAHLHSIVFFN
jgi:histone H2B